MKARLTPEQMNAITNNVRSKLRALEDLNNEIDGFVAEHYKEGALEEMTADRDAIRVELCSWYDKLNPSVDVLERVQAFWNAINAKDLQDPQEKEDTLKFISELINQKHNNSPVTDSKTKLRALELVFNSIPTLDHYASTLEWCDKNIARANEGRVDIQNYVLSDTNSKIANKYGMLSNYPGTVGAYINKLEDFMKTGQERLSYYQDLQIAYIMGAASFYSVQEYLNRLNETTSLTNAQKYGIELFKGDVYTIQRNIVPVLSMVDAEAEREAKRDKLNYEAYVSPKDTVVCQTVERFASSYNVKRSCARHGIGATCSPSKRTNYYCKKCTRHQGIDKFYEYCAAPNNKEYVLHRYSPLLRMEVLDFLSNNDFFTSLYSMMSGEISQGYFRYVAGVLEKIGGDDIMVVPAMNLYIDADRYNHQKYVGREEADKVRINQEMKNTESVIGGWYDMLISSNDLMQFIRQKNLHVGRERGDNEPF